MKEGENMQADKQLLVSLEHLSKAELSLQERTQIMGRLEQRMNAWEHKSRKRRRTHRIGRIAGWAAAGIVAGGAAGFLLFNMPWMQPFGSVRTGDNTHYTVPSGAPGKPSNSDSSATPNLQQQNPPEDAEQRALVQKIAVLAKEGLVPDCKFAAGKSMIDEIKQEWGDPTNEGAAGQGIYATYPQRGYDFGFNKGSQVFDVRSYAPAIKQIKYSTVKAVLGEPTQVNYYADPKQNILIYKAGDQYELQFIFPEPTAQILDPTLDHISVFFPKDAVPNSMAK